MNINQTSTRATRTLYQSGLESFSFVVVKSEMRWCAVQRAGEQTNQQAFCGAHLLTIFSGVCQMKMAPSEPTLTMNLWSGEISI